MLVLTRKDGETICIGNEIEITVCDLMHGRVKLGIRCPQDVLILRKELTERKVISRDLTLVET